MVTVIKCRAAQLSQIHEYAFVNGWMDKDDQGAPAIYTEHIDTSVIELGPYVNGDNREHAEIVLIGDAEAGWPAQKLEHMNNGTGGNSQNKNETSMKWRNVEIIEDSSIATPGYMI